MQNQNRRVFIVRSLAFLGLIGLGADATFGASVGELLDSEFLKTELRVKTDAEGAFVADVVDKVKEGELPLKTLQIAYSYAMKKDKSRRVIYFKKCLEILTQRAGIKIKFLNF